MKIFPAIDIKDKKCVRLVKGNFDNKTEYNMSPVEQASKFKDHGFKNFTIFYNIDLIPADMRKFKFSVLIIYFRYFTRDPP